MNYKSPNKFVNLGSKNPRLKLKGLSKIVRTSHNLIKQTRPVRAYNYAGSFWNYIQRLRYE